MNFASDVRFAIRGLCGRPCRHTRGLGRAAGNVLWLVMREGLYRRRDGRAGGRGGRKSTLSRPLCLVESHIDKARDVRRHQPHVQFRSGEIHQGGKIGQQQDGRGDSNSTLGNRGTRWQRQQHIGGHRECARLGWRPASEVTRHIVARAAESGQRNPRNFDVCAGFATAPIHCQPVLSRHRGHVTYVPGHRNRNLDLRRREGAHVRAAGAVIEREGAA